MKNYHLMPWQGYWPPCEREAPEDGLEGGVMELLWEVHERAELTCQMQDSVALSLRPCLFTCLPSTH